MIHKKCGGFFKIILRTKERTVFECNVCGKILTLWRTATGGSPKKNREVS